VKLPHYLLLSGIGSLLLLAGCRYYQPAGFTYEQQQVHGDDTLLQYIITPYRDGLQAEMESVIGWAAQDWKKGKPESTLGNLITDIMLEAGDTLFQHTPDFALYNYGGIRIDAIYSGAITKGKIFELLPFDNTMVMVTLDGYSTARLLNTMAAAGGWPQSGLQLTIKNEAAVDVLVHRLPFDTAATYYIVMNDYMARGGDGLDMLTDAPMEDAGITVRDIVMRGIEQRSGNGQALSIETDNRTISE
jgi:2',3'-cyclic-nucleotide 2'-phosphodiesterase (5'-nucleotidase family)